MGWRKAWGGSAALVAALAVLLALSLPASGASRRDPLFPSASADERPPSFGQTYPVAATASWLEAAITLRSTELTTLTNELSVSTTIFAKDRAALQALLSADTVALSALSQRVPTDTSIASLQIDASSLIDGYHVLALVEPVVTDVLAIDADLVSQSQLATQATALEAAITAAQQAKHNVITVQGDYADLAKRLRGVSSQLTGLAGTLEALSAPSWPLPRAELRNATDSLSVAGTDLSDASFDTSAIVRLLARLGTHNGHKTR